MKPNSNPSISDELCWDFFVGGDFVLSIFRMEEQWYNLNNLIEEGGTHMTERTYLAIDLKSFYASVECMERSLDPMTTNLVVADASRTEKTICLAVSPLAEGIWHPRPGEAIRGGTESQGSKSQTAAQRAGI